MDIGSEFDEEFFEKPKVKREKESEKYDAKVCVPLWYMNLENVSKEKPDMLVALKHQADYYYFSGNYTKAAEAYKHCLELLPKNNNTWRREFMENLARSFLHLDDADKALEWGLKLHASSCNSDQKIISLNLLAAVCHQLGKYKEELEALHCCIQVHKCCPEFWLRLAYCYAGLFRIELPGDLNLKLLADPQMEPCCAFSAKLTNKSPQSATSKCDACANSVPAESAIASCSDCLDTDEICSSAAMSTHTAKCEMCSFGIQIVATCLIQTRTLIDNNGNNPFGYGQNAKFREKISKGLLHMEVDQSFIDEASKMLGSDFLASLPENPDTLLLDKYSETSIK